MVYAYGYSLHRFCVLIHSYVDCRPSEERNSFAYTGEPSKYVFLRDILVHEITDISLVVALPKDAFEKLEAAAAAHPPQRVVNPSKNWGLGFDVFDEEWPF